MIEYLTHPMNQIMSLILDVRYTDLERERSLSQELLDWSETEKDAYAKVFALTYLGDYALAVCDEESAGKHLLEAERLLKEHKGWDFLRLQIYRFLGIYHDMRMDEQGAINTSLQAIAAAGKLGDALSESVVLNNLASIFSRHNCFVEAREYFLKAFHLQAPLKNVPIRSVLLVNLAETCLRLGSFQEAREYIEACEEAEKEQSQPDVLSSGCWCSYYASIGDREKAVHYALQLLHHQSTDGVDKLTSFDHYYTLCERMLELGEKDCSLAFLRLLEKSDSAGGLERMKRLVNIKTRCAIQFGTEEERDEACRSFFKQNCQFREQTMAITVEAMKSKIYLDKLLQQTTRMRTEQQDLEREVQLDELTGIYNRRFMEGIMREHTQREDAKSLGVILADVDYFKEYNDFYGHLQGDMVLKEIADCLRAVKTRGIYPCRYGGDEFVCLCEDLPAEKMEEYIVAVRDCLRQKSISHEKSRCESVVTLSIGYVAEVPGERAEGHFLLQLADQALYESKRMGRNTYTRNKAKSL